MFNKAFITLLLSLFVVIFGTSCEKLPGEGGAATIKGKIFVEEYLACNAGQPHKSYFVPEERIYILYGQDDNTYDDDTRSSFDGSFAFEFLRTGNYRVVVYSDLCGAACSDSACTEEIIKDIEITSTNENVDLGDIIIRKY